MSCGAAARAAPSAFLFVFLVDRRAEARGRAQRFAVVEHGQVAHVQRQPARRRLLLDHHGDRAAFHALAEADTASAAETCVRESLHGALPPGSILLQERLDLLLELRKRRNARVLLADLPIPSDDERRRNRPERTVRVLELL